MPSTSSKQPNEPQISSVDLAIPSISSKQPDLPLNHPKSFETILLQQLKQMPIPTKSGRKRICGGAEVITSSEAITKLKEQANKFKKTQETSTKKGGKRMKKIQLYEEETDEDSPTEMEVNTSDDDYNLEDEVNDVSEEEEFMKYLDKDPQTLIKGDWILAKFPTKKSFKFYVGQITEVEPCLEAKFTRRSGSSSQFYWPDTEDVSIINREQIQLCLPTPDIRKRGKICFNVTFEQNVN